MSLTNPTGIADPIVTTPPRRAGSVRRTSHIDINREPSGALRLQGAARDLRTGATASEVLQEATVDALLDAQHTLIDLQTSPGDDRTAALIGGLVGRGFRAAVDAAVPDQRATSTPLYLLLDELPVAALISGYALLYRGDLNRDRLDAGQVRADICAGWRSDGTMVVSLRKNGSIPVPYGPPADPLEREGDDLSWHAIPTLPVGAMRRRRLVDLAEGDPLDVYAMFRDTYVDSDGAETILHEYSVTGSLDRGNLMLTHCVAQPHVLPWTECPAAAASATRLAGRTVSDIRRIVAHEFRGTMTCTHLNDLLRSLADLNTLTDQLPPHAP